MDRRGFLWGAFASLAGASATEAAVSKAFAPDLWPPMAAAANSSPGWRPIAARTRR